MTWQRVYVAESTVRLPVFRFAEQRAQCERCAHVRISQCRRGVVLVGCSLARGHNHGAGPASFERLDDGLCGPDARHFRAR